jgi:hypothetical protein
MSLNSFGSFSLQFLDLPFHFLQFLCDLSLHLPQFLLVDCSFDDGCDGAIL